MSKQRASFVAVGFLGGVAAGSLVWSRLQRQYRRKTHAITLHSSIGAFDRRLRFRLVVIHRCASDEFCNSLYRCAIRHRLLPDWTRRQHATHRLRNKLIDVANGLSVLILIATVD